MKVTITDSSTMCFSQVVPGIVVGGRVRITRGPRSGIFPVSRPGGSPRQFYFVKGSAEIKEFHSLMLGASKSSPVEVELEVELEVLGE